MFVIRNLFRTKGLRVRLEPTIVEYLSAANIIKLFWRNLPINCRNLSQNIKGTQIVYCEIKEQRRLFASADFYCEILSDRYIHRNGVL